MNSMQILCFGDSNTWGYIPVVAGRYPRNVRWPGALRERLGAGFEVIEEGQSGRTTTWDDSLEGGNKNGLRYLSVCLESHKPLDLVILMLGTNDLKARFSLTALDIALGVERLVLATRQSACGVAGQPPAILLVAPPPVAPTGDSAETFSGAAEKSLLLGKRYADVATRTGCAFLDLGPIIAVDPSDGIHYSAATHLQLGEAIASKVLSMVPGLR